MNNLAGVKNILVLRSRVCVHPPSPGSDPHHSATFKQIHYSNMPLWASCTFEINAPAAAGKYISGMIRGLLVLYYAIQYYMALLPSIHPSINCTVCMTISLTVSGAGHRVIESSFDLFVRNAKVL
jgi:hypothetical protein